MNPAKKTIQFLHFNDAYHLRDDKHEPVGSASRISSKIKELKNNELETSVVTFGGDICENFLYDYFLG